MPFSPPNTASLPHLVNTSNRGSQLTDNQRRLAALALHAGLLTALYSALYCFGVFVVLPNNESLASWDVGALLAISQQGYPNLSPDHKAFFPLMPYMWRWLHLSMLQASILNSLLTLAGLYILGNTFQLSSRQLLLLASSPLLLFGLVPYTEGFFFLFTALLLSGLHRQQLPLTLLGLLGCCLTRSAATLFVPAYIFAELLAWGETSSSQVLLRNLGTGLATIFGSLALVVWAQASPNTELFAFYSSHANWGQILRLPELPVHSSAGPPVLWLDATGLAVSLLSLVGCAALGLRWIKQHARGPVSLGMSKALLFALGYCVGAGFFVVFYQGGDLVGMSRYIMGSAFWVALLAYAWQAPWPMHRALGALLLVWLVVSVISGLPSHVQNFTFTEALWYFGLWLIYLASYWFSQKRNSPWFREISTSLYFINLLALVCLLHLFLNKIWVN